MHALSSQRPLAKLIYRLMDGLTGACLGAAFYGSWGVFANWAHGVDIALRSGAAQGAMSFVVTLTGVTLMKRLFSMAGPLWWRASVAAIGALILIYGLIVGVHLAIGTPEILLTLAPGLPITIAFCLVFVGSLVRLDEANDQSINSKNIGQGGTSVRLTKLVQDNIQTLDEAVALIESLPRADETLGYAGGAGPHLRHVLDHYDALLAGSAAGVVDYDSRERCQQTELSPAFAARRLRGIVRQLEALAEQGDGELRVRLCTDSHSEAEQTTSTIARELQFLHSHCVHHFALIRHVLGAQGIELDGDFGKAPATLSHERASA